MPQKIKKNVDNIPYKLRQVPSTGSTKCQSPMGSSDKSIYFWKHYEINQSLHKIFSWTGLPRQGRSLPFTQFFENRQKCIRRILSCIHWLQSTPWKVLKRNTKTILWTFLYLKSYFMENIKKIKEPSSFHLIFANMWKKDPSSMPCFNLALLFFSQTVTTHFLTIRCHSNCSRNL